MILSNRNGFLIENKGSYVTISYSCPERGFRRAPDYTIKIYSDDRVEVRRNSLVLGPPFPWHDFPWTDVDAANIPDLRRRMIIGLSKYRESELEDDKFRDRLTDLAQSMV